MSYSEVFNQRASETDNQEDRVFLMLKAIYHKLCEVKEKTGK